MPDAESGTDACLVLMAHGSRNPNWLLPFQQLADALKRDAGKQAVQLCYMEFSSPSLREMAQQLYTEGARSMRLLPLFLAKGSHLCQDVPAILSDLKAEFPDLTIDLLPPIGENQQFAELLNVVVKGYIRPPLT